METLRQVIHHLRLRWVGHYYLNHENKQLEQMFEKITDAIENRDKDQIKKIIDLNDPPTKVKEHRTEVFKYALRLNDFPMVEMLYDYWSGDLHWMGHDIDKLNTLGQLLEDARVVCEVKNQHLLKNIHSLIKFNAFQKTLYSKISQLPNTEPKETASMLVQVLRLYDTYSDLEKVRIPQENEEQERKLKAYFADKSSEYMEGLSYIYYEVYFRKLDFNVALLIFENLIDIRQHLNEIFNKPQETNKGEESFKDEAHKYKEIECALYHFIYRTAEDWSLYLPENRQLTTETHHKGIHEGNIIDLLISHDEYKLFYAQLLFLQRKNFTKSLTELKIILEKYSNISLPAPASEQGVKLIDEKYLIPTYMSDYYSLSKIVYYIGALENTKHKNINVLMIERVLQVTGEMTKSSKETNHLLESTKSLLQIGIPEETIRYLRYIRNYLSNVYRDQLSSRIDIAKEQAQIFDDVKKDLKEIKIIINSIRDIYKPILSKSLLENDLRLIKERIKYMYNNLPDEALRYRDFIQKNYKRLANEKDLLSKEIYTGLTIQRFKEIICLLEIEDAILSDINEVERTISKHIVSVLPMYIQNIRQTLELINENQKNVKIINKQLLQYKVTELSDNPNMEEINNVKKTLRRNEKKRKNTVYNIDFQTLSKINDFSRRWEEMLSFCLNNGELLVRKVPKRLLTDDLDISTVTKILKELEDKCKHSSPCKNLTGNHSFGGIKTLHDIFKEKNKIVISKNLSSTQHSNSPQTSAREKLISCLCSRMNLLKKILQYKEQISPKDIAPSYKNDLEFRFVLEMILADIANILVNCGIKNLMNKSYKLLRKIDLGNVLDHGNPFLDVIGDVFDSYDLSTELLTKAIMFAKDGKSIEALFKLIKDNVDYETIKKEKLEEMNDKQKEHYKDFQDSLRWEFYVKLVPNPTVTPTAENSACDEE